jgi:hypothetical protein
MGRTNGKFVGAKDAKNKKGKTIPREALQV